MLQSVYLQSAYECQDDPLARALKSARSNQSATTRATRSVDVRSPESYCTVDSLHTNCSDSDSAVLDYLVTSLGIEPEEAHDFGWIAEIAIQAELPPGWTSQADEPAGAIYYVNKDTLTSTFEHPLTPFLKQVVEIARLYLEFPSENFFHEQKAWLWQMHKDELDFWYGPVHDEEGNSYYMSEKDGISSWQDPRQSRAYIYDLQCVLLNHLQTQMAAEENGCFDGGTPWENENGAQVLTLQSEPRRETRRPSKSSMIAHSLQCLRVGQNEHTIAMQQLQRVNNLAEWMQSTVEAEEQLQRDRMTQRVEERRKRSNSRRSSKATRIVPGSNLDFAEPSMQIREMTIKRIETAVLVET